jgi:hypothetical protein
VASCSPRYWITITIHNSVRYIAEVKLDFVGFAGRDAVQLDT